MIANPKKKEADMRNCTVPVATLLAAGIVLASSDSVKAADEQPYLSQDHGTVRVLRDLKPGKKFEAAKIPEEIDVAPAAASEPQVEPSPTTAQVYGGFFEKAQGRWVSEWEKAQGGTEISTTTFDYYGRMDSVPGPTATFYFADENGKWEGYWVDLSNSGPHPCDTTRDESPYWGVLEFQFNEPYNQFEGTWDFCGKGAKHGWKGKRRL
jgi:hypothetical protein